MTKNQLTDAVGMAAALPFFVTGWVLKRLWLALKFMANAVMTGIEIE
jgi:hypothetical protein